MRYGPDGKPSFFHELIEIGAQGAHKIYEAVEPTIERQIAEVRRTPERIAEVADNIKRILSEKIADQCYKSTHPLNK